MITLQSYTNYNKMEQGYLVEPSPISSVEQVINETSIKLDLLASCALINNRIEDLRKIDYDPLSLPAVIQFSYGIELKLRKNLFQRRNETRRYLKIISQLQDEVKKISKFNTKLHIQNELLRLEKEKFEIQNQILTNKIQELETHLLEKGVSSKHF